MMEIHFTHVSDIVLKLMQRVDSERKMLSLAVDESPSAIWNSDNLMIMLNNRDSVSFLFFLLLHSLERR